MRTTRAVSLTGAEVEVDPQGGANRCEQLRLDRRTPTSRWPLTNSVGVPVTPSAARFRQISARPRAVPSVIERRREAPRCPDQASPPRAIEIGTFEVCWLANSRSCISQNVPARPPPPPLRAPAPRAGESADGSVLEDDLHVLLKVFRTSSSIGSTAGRKTGTRNPRTDRITTWRGRHRHAAGAPERPRGSRKANANTSASDAATRFEDRRQRLHHVAYRFGMRLTGGSGGHGLGRMLVDDQARVPGGSTCSDFRNSISAFCSRCRQLLKRASLGQRLAVVGEHRLAHAS